MQETQLRSLLRGGGYKLTPSRERILSVLSSQRRGFTAAELLESVRASDPEIGRATVFRTLDTLISLDALERIRLPGGQEGYVLCEPTHHHHVVCSSCGAIGEVDAAVFDRTLAAAVRDSGFTLQAHTLELLGVCSVCSPEGPR